MCHQVLQKNLHTLLALAAHYNKPALVALQGNLLGQIEQLSGEATLALSGPTSLIIDRLDVHSASPLYCLVRLLCTHDHSL